MDQFEVELSRLAAVGYYNLPLAAEQASVAELEVSRCDGLHNRRLFVKVDEAWEDLRDNGLRPSLRKLTETIEATADALRVVHARYGGADQSQAAQLESLRQAADARVRQEGEIAMHRDLAASYFDVHDRQTADELSDDAVHDAIQDDRFIPQPD